MGYPFDKECGWSKTKEEGSDVKIRWYFDTTHVGEYGTIDNLFNWWYDDEWFAENYPKHPFSVVMSALLTKEYLVDKINEQKAKVVVKRKGKTWICYEDSEIYKRIKDL